MFIWPLWLIVFKLIVQLFSYIPSFFVHSCECKNTFYYLRKSGHLNAKLNVWKLSFLRHGKLCCAYKNLLARSISWAAVLPVHI